MKCRGRRAIPMALRPPLSIKRAGATANLCIIARAWPAEVSEPLITSLLWKPAATEVRCGIELSLCSAACPSGTIYTSFWPDICAGLLGGSSAAPLSVGLPFEFSSDLQIRRRRCRGEHVYKFTFNVANRHMTEARGCGAIRLALGAPWFCSFFLDFVGTLVTVEVWAVLRDLA
ncbi:hypothetical protein THAOC_11931 [Thalassiosira oceanica]|uniref:Uncharacterized protein n=1 Tax=Thalassiosira oceanica TaxID=159749 RepID=K0T1D3_THAOC|nr:hypothetical protein THAOC_11931 [Thalassiosira oceanica]|eukprot:EJK67081.1 hypothetical protein THAOC_11931 [Thalassiosira oceanica]